MLLVPCAGTIEHYIAACVTLRKKAAFHRNRAHRRSKGKCQLCGFDIDALKKQVVFMYSDHSTGRANCKRSPLRKKGGVGTC